jgi:hypothetical protein
MKLVKPVHDFDFESADGKLQYKHKQGTLAQQIAAFRNEGGLGSFSWPSAPAVRELIVDNPELELGDNWYRTGSGVDYAHENDGRVSLYFSPQNRILLAREARFQVPFDGKALEQLAADAKQTDGGVLVVDLDALSNNNAWKSDGEEYGHLVLSTTDYEKQMSDDPAVAALVSAGYSPKGETLKRIMHGIRQRSSETWTFALQPGYVRKNASEGTGLGRLSAVYNYYVSSNFYANRNDIVNRLAFAFGVRQAARSADAPKKD